MHLPWRVNGQWFNAQKQEWRQLQGSQQAITLMVLYGTLAVALLLTALLFLYDLSVLHQLRVRTLAGIATILYVAIGLFFTYHNRVATANWMIILLYESLVAIVFLRWGISVGAGIFAVCFVVTLPSVLLGARYIFPVTGFTIALIALVQTMHSSGTYTPELRTLSTQPTYWDVLVHATLLGIFALVSWLSRSQVEKSIERAEIAETRLRAQHETVAAELKQESATLRQMQLKQFRQVYQFALIGQSSAATLHELSNHLSILNLDIDDLCQQNKNSAAIDNARSTIQHINKTVRQARQQLNTQTTDTVFNIVSVINESIADLAPKYAQRQVTLTKHIKTSVKPATTTGDPMALMQIMNVLLNNALEACQDLYNPWVRAEAVITTASVEITVTDSGPGIDTDAKRSLFQPGVSTKPAGLGVGLYLARQLVKNHFGGTLRLTSPDQPTEAGARFSVKFPRAQEKHSERARQ